MQAFTLVRGLALVLSIVGTGLTLPVGSEEPVNLRPIGIRDYEAATGLRPREDRSFVDLDFATAQELIYGSVGRKCFLLGVYD